MLKEADVSKPGGGPNPGGGASPGGPIEIRPGGGDVGYWDADSPWNYIHLNNIKSNNIWTYFSLMVPYCFDAAMGGLLGKGYWRSYWRFKTSQFSKHHQCFERVLDRFAKEREAWCSKEKNLKSRGEKCFRTLLNLTDTAA